MTRFIKMLSCIIFLVSEPSTMAGEIGKESQFLMVNGDMKSTIYDLSTVQEISLNRYSVVGVTIDEPEFMNYELGVFGEMQRYCTKAAGKYAPTNKMLSAGPPNLPVRKVWVGGGKGAKRLLWDYPYTKFLNGGMAMDCADLSETATSITNGYSNKDLFDCDHGLIGMFMDEIDGGDPAKVMMAPVVAFSTGEEKYKQVCLAVTHKVPYLPSASRVQQNKE